MMGAGEEPYFEQEEPLPENSASQASWQLSQEGNSERKKRRRTVDRSSTDNDSRKKRKLNDIDETYLELKKMPYQEIPEPVLDNNSPPTTEVSSKPPCTRKVSFSEV